MMYLYKIKNVIENTFNLDIRRKVDTKVRTTYNLINEAINFEKGIIFIAIPKTGTTSIRNQIRQPGRPLIEYPHLDISQIKDLIYFSILRENLGTNKTFPNENLPSDEDFRQQAEEIFKSFFKFSAVRNPWARAVSLYSRREGVKLKDKMTFDEFCENHNYASDTCCNPSLHKNQLDWLTTNNGKLLMDFVYRVEEFDKAIDQIHDRTNGKLSLNKIKRNVNPNSKSSVYREMYNDRTRKLIAKRFEKDIDYFKYTF